MFFKRITLFRFFGFEIKADASWIFISVLLAWSFSTNVYPHLFPGAGTNTYQLMAVATVIGLIASIIAHEVAHAVIAEYYHMPIIGITLFIFGGVAEMRGDPSHPKGEFLMAVAGPIMSALLGLFFWASAAYAAPVGGKTSLSVVLDHLGFINLALAAFNILPAYPLDGGRALRAVIWYRKRNLVLATRIASSLGAFFAYLLMAFACYKIVWSGQLLAGMWIGVGALFLHGAGAAALRHTESRSLLGLEPVARFTTAGTITISPDLTLQEFVDNYVYAHYQRSFPVIDNGRVIGSIALQTILPMERHKWHFLHVGTVLEPLSGNNSVAPDHSAADALEVMQKTGNDMLIVARGSQYIGTVAFRDLAAYLSISRNIDQNRSVAASR